MSVEWVRSCYESEWRLFRDDPEMRTRGRYYFSPPGTPHVSTMHNFGSRNWVDRNNGVEQGLGENLDTPQKWNRGDPPAFFPLNRSTDKGNCLLTGDLVDDGIDYNDAINGFPVACYPPRFNADYEAASAFASCSMQFFYSTLLQWIYDAEASNIATAVTLLLGVDAVTTYHPVAGSFPALATIVHPEYSIAVVSGTSNFQQLALQGFYGLGGPTNIGIFGTNFQHFLCSQWVNNNLAADGADPTKPVMLVGHSYGAAACVILAARYKFNSPDREIRYLTYGDPKPGDARLRDLLDSLAGYALQNDGDLVTALPPDGNEIEPVVLALGLPSLRQYALWRFSPGAQLMDDTGTLYPGESPILDYSTLLGYVNRALLSLPIGVIVNHAVPVYRERILRRCPNPEWPVSTALFNFLLGMLLPEYFGDDYFGLDYFGDDYFF